MNEYKYTFVQNTQAYRLMHDGTRHFGRLILDAPVFEIAENLPYRIVSNPSSISAKRFIHQSNFYVPSFLSTEHLLNKNPLLPVSISVKEGLYNVHLEINPRIIFKFHF